MKIKLVKFKDGTFGVRKGFFIFKYFDFKTSGFWWNNTSQFFKCCKTTEEKAKSVFYELTDKGIPVE